MEVRGVIGARNTEGSLRLRLILRSSSYLDSAGHITSMSWLSVVLLIIFQSCNYTASPTCAVRWRWCITG